MSDFGELKSEIVDYLGSQITSSRAAKCVARAEDRIQHDVRYSDMEQTQELDITTDPVTVPTTLLEPRAIYLNTSTDRQRVDYLSPSAYWAKSPDVVNIDNDLPRFFTLEGRNIVWTPPPGDGQTAFILFFGKYTPFSSDTDTNALLENNFNIYLYASLLEGVTYTGNDPRALTWGTLYDEAVAKANRTDRRLRFFQGNKTAIPRSVRVW